MDTRPDPDPGRRRRRAIAVTVILSLVAIVVRVLAETRNVVAAAATGTAILAFWAFLRALTGRKRRVNDEAVDRALDPEADAGLALDCLPGDWPSIAVETLPAAAGNQATSLGVHLRASDGWLLVEKRRIFGAGRHPFEARAPLAALQDVRVGKPLLGLVGSSLTFQLDSSEIRADVNLSQAAAERLAARFLEAAAATRRGARPSSGALEVTSPPPPRRTPPATAGILTMVVFVPFAVAMVGAPDGPFAATSTFTLMLVTLALSMRRPVSMPATVAVGLLVTAGAFVIDARRTGEVARLAGTATCLVIAAAVARRSRRAAPVSGRAVVGVALVLVAGALAMQLSVVFGLGLFSPETEDPESVVARINVAATDLPSGWTVVRLEPYPKAELRDTRRCNRSSLWAASQSGSIHEFSLLLDRDGNEQGHLSASTIVVESGQAASRQMDLIRSPIGRSCFVESTREDLMRTLGRANLLESSVTQPDRQLPVAGVLYRVTTTYRYGSGPGEVDQYFTDRFSLVSGRLRANVTFERCCQPFDDAFEHDVLRRVVARMQATEEGRPG